MTEWGQPGTIRVPYREQQLSSNKARLFFDSPRESGRFSAHFHIFAILLPSPSLPVNQRLPTHVSACLEFTYTCVWVKLKSVVSS